MNNNNNGTSARRTLLRILSGSPDAAALIKGVGEYPDISGITAFFQTNRGVIVAANIENLPDIDTECGDEVFGFHIHEGKSCTGNEVDLLSDTLGHYSPNECPHPFHAGDLPPLFSNDGTALMMVLTNRFKLSDVIGRTVVVHRSPDDFTTQPSGNSGVKIACGVIESRQ